MIPFLGIKKFGDSLPENRKIQEIHFMCFDRYEIHIQAFHDLINAIAIIFKSSSSQNINQNEVLNSLKEKTKEKRYIGLPQNLKQNQNHRVPYLQR